MNRPQIALVASAVALFFILYFGCDVKSKEQKVLAKSRALTTETLDASTLVQTATKSLNPTQAADIQQLTQRIGEPKDPSVLKQLSSAWHNAAHDEVAAYYAEQVADIEKTDVA